MHEFGSMVGLLRHRAATQPDDRAYVFLPDRGGAPVTLTYADLLGRAEALASRLMATGEARDRAVLMFPPGLDFMVGFFGCLIAGMIAVPMMVPRRQSARDAGASILADCRPRFALTTSEVTGGARSDIPARFAGTGIELLAIDDPEIIATPRNSALPEPRRSDLALLQYTSGSTAAPKGVMVSHGNLLDNLEMIRRACENTPASTYVSWVPLYHDMGLVLNALQALYIGAPCVLMAPVSFLQRPHLWLRAIHDYRAEVAGGPNFAFDLCVDRLRPEQMDGIDLSHWKIAFAGAEPLRAETIQRFITAFRPYGFAPETMWPGYGMAEATLLISGSRRGAGACIRTISRDGLQHHRALEPTGDADRQPVVGCGRALEGERVAIVDPATARRLPADHVGEVWVAGANVAQGYWRNPEATAKTFAGTIAGEDDTTWLRTGDLAFMDANGEIFITGRLKDVLIIRGVNHYPQDIEATVQDSHPGLRRHGGAAFAVALPDHGEALVIVQEIERTERHAIDPGEIIATIREAVIREHEVAPHQIVLIRPATLPKTTSGKIQRSLARELWRNNQLATLNEYLKVGENE